jgi:hypothetical protein
LSSTIHNNLSITSNLYLPTKIPVNVDEFCDDALFIVWTFPFGSVIFNVYGVVPPYNCCIIILPSLDWLVDGFKSRLAINLSACGPLILTSFVTIVPKASTAVILYRPTPKLDIVSLCLTVVGVLM